MEELGVCITLLDAVYSCTLLFSSSLQNCQTNSSPLEGCPECSLIRGKGPLLLGNVELEYDKKCGVEEHFGLGHKLATPSGEEFSRVPKLMEKVLVWLGVTGLLRPTFKHDLVETRKASPKVLKFEIPRS
jgi:hypothetical protein